MKKNLIILGFTTLLLLCGCAHRTVAEKGYTRVSREFVRLTRHGKMPGLEKLSSVDDTRFSFSVFLVDDSIRTPAHLQNFPPMPLDPCRQLFMVSAKWDLRHWDYFFCADRRRPELRASYEWQDHRWTFLPKK
jgi:hypothetical protein